MLLFLLDCVFYVDVCAVNKLVHWAKFKMVKRKQNTTEKNGSRERIWAWKWKRKDATTHGVSFALQGLHGY